MKKFKDFITEEMMPYAQTEKGFVGVDNGPVRDNINIHLTAITARPYATPYHALEMVRKVLAPFHIFIPSTNFLDGDAGHEVFNTNQFGNKYGQKNDGETVYKNSDDYFIYFEYQMNDRGSFDIFSEVVSQEELEEILNDIEAELEEGPTTDGDGKDAEDSFDEYKSDNQIKEDKDPCWDNPPHKMVGMKMKNGRKVPKCVPVEEEQLNEGPFSKIGKLIMKRKLKGEIKKHGDKADDALNKNAVPGAPMNSNWDEKTWSKESKQENRKKKVLKRLEKK